MGKIGSEEIYLIWAKFGIIVISSGLIDITGSTLKGIYAVKQKINKTHSDTWW